MSDFSYHMPMELMEILNRINDNVNDVKMRVTRIEAQDHSDRIKHIHTMFEKERAERVSLQIELAAIKTKLIPIGMFITMVAGVVVDLMIRNVHVSL